MADPFFDLGKHLQQIDNAGLHAYLASNDQVFERAFTPAGRFEPVAGLHVQFKDRRFKNMRFYQVHFKNITFTRCVFEECLLLSATIEDCEFHDCTFIRCNTHKFRLVNTYLDPRAFLSGMFDHRQYSNVGVDLFQALLHNASQETQPDFRQTAEYFFRVWKRYNDIYAWKLQRGLARWSNYRFFGIWLASFLSQHLFGYGLRLRNVFFWTGVLLLLTFIFNSHFWDAYRFDQPRLASLSNASHSIKVLYFTIGNLSTFGTGEIAPTSSFGLVSVATQVTLGISWIAIATAMIVKRLIR